MADCADIIKHIHTIEWELIHLHIQHFELQLQAMSVIEDVLYCLRDHYRKVTRNRR